jgi:hypothetical protein
LQFFTFFLQSDQGVWGYFLTVEEKLNRKKTGDSKNIHKEIQKYRKTRLN